MTVDILCIGEPMVEFNETDSGGYLAGFGGDVSNCAVAAARSGASVGMATRLGADPFGEKLTALWRAEGVDASAVELSATAPTGVYFVSHGPEGHQFSYYRAGSAASRMGPGDIPRAAIEGAKIVHLSGISQAISESAADACFQAITVAKAAGVRVSYDTNLRLKLWPLPRARAIINAAAAEADILLPGHDDAAALTGLSDPEAIVEHYLALGPSIVALTLGKEGALIGVRSAAGIERRTIAAWPVEAVDATAAGDTFDGAFLAEIVAGRDPFEAASYANAAAALSTLGYGAVAPMPRRADVEAFIAARKAAR